jgi:hypothetical protein
MKYMFLLLGLLAALYAPAQTPARRLPIRQRYLSDTSRWVFVRIPCAFPAEPLPPAPVVLPPAKPADTLAASKPTPPISPTISVAIQTTTVLPPPPPPPARLTFIERFDNYDNHWTDGQVGNYVYQLDPYNNAYTIQRKATGRSATGKPVRPTTGKPALSFVSLPAGMDLNQADSFTLSVTIAVPPGVPANGGLVLGLLNADNYCHFMLVGDRLVSVKWVVNGGNMVYMPGKPVAALVPIGRTLNVLTVRKGRDKKDREMLYFTVNGREIQASPYTFQPFRGNKIGFISAGAAIKFQNLSLVVSPPR